MSDDPYPFESDYDLEIRELDLEDVDALDDERITVGELAGENESWRYGHVIVDEAQDLTPMQWRMIMRRVRGRSLTIVGDLAQRTLSDAAPAERWEDLLPRELRASRRQDLTVNYRSPVEIHELAGRVLAEFAPAVAPSRAIRRSGSPPEFVSVDPTTTLGPTSLGAAINATVHRALDAVGGLVAVIGPDGIDLASLVDSGEPAESAVSPLNSPASQTESVDSGPDWDRVRFLTPIEAKGLEFDAVVLVEPGAIWDQDAGPGRLYIALTRATQRLFVVHQRPLPPSLRIDS